MGKYSEFYEARNLITDILKQDLIGPVEKDEVLIEPPLQYYLMGKLYPQSSSEEVVDSSSGTFFEDETQSFDPSVSLSNQNDPSSLGITFTLKPGINDFNVKGQFAFYTSFSFDEAKESGIDVTDWENKDKKPKNFWKRTEYEFEQEVKIQEHKNIVIKLQKNIELWIYTNYTYKDGEKVITAVLLNTAQNDSSNNYDYKCEHTAFQVELKVFSNKQNCIFGNVTKQEKVSNDEELKELEMLYSNIICYAHGHGCSVIWEHSLKGPSWIKSEFLPQYSLKLMKPGNLSGADNFLSMKYLAYAEKKDVITGLRNIVLQYKEWIDNLICPDERYKDSAERNIQRCKNTCSRIENAIEMLNNSNNAYQAFKLANEAMFMQQKKSRKIEDKDDDTIKWYPFQLAFMLQELPSFINPKLEERNKVDLLWFPTGGGKTEAYLGIAAFVIFLRRLNNCNDNGVTVLMRYTLRLLTIQQFERACRLIFACELLRKKYDLGGDEISIGMWVGDSLTPNKIDDARSALDKKRTGQTEVDKDPCQIKVCPWCGETIRTADYEINPTIKRMFVRCPNQLCDFHKKNGMPIHILDEQIYEYTPTFIVATVDKFAQLAFNDLPGTLFGIENNKNPPELIIQDELHLISGPLGTMTGIYEAAITELCKKNGINTKVIASTATIRNASSQIKGIYGREFTQFPPQGVSTSNSFFAVESTEDDRPSRQYLAVMGVGSTPTTTFIRVNAALYFASRYLASKNFSDSVIDNFWTITDYFNSLRELGGARIQIQDDVQSRFEYLKSKFKKYKYSTLEDEKIDHVLELTSALSNNEITDTISKLLPTKYTSQNHHDVYDFLLASNMISVGVDVNRLGTMVVLGQPKTNAEYIQATSRVGRTNPGLVISVYNPGRSRDRSHYEQFYKYHSSLYRYVEATSVTPFADRARDRGLHALYVILCRHLVPSLRKNDGAEKYKKNLPEVIKIKQDILNYVKEVDAEEYKAVEKQLTDIINEWEYRIKPGLVYKDYRDDNKSLLKPDTDTDCFRTMNSLRSVDPQSDIYILTE